MKLRSLFRPSVKPEPFVVSICPDCGGELVWDRPVLPGEVGVVQCRCREKWALVAPSAYIVRAREVLE